ncbi:unnamed protein product [Cuscuta epithymum]|uniref:Uncharacterized protein n=1 Tax=Cuscuta epithymum TaxID=186058 RepID=A0AAV0EDG1_9ASTE|nr:unnamed protein product [Cuscuta epithymum]
MALMATHYNSYPNPISPTSIQKCKVKPWMCLWLVGERDQVGAHSHAAYDNDEVDLDNILSLHNEMEGDDDDMDNTEHAFKLCDVLFQPNDEDEIVGGQSNNMKNTFVFCY